MDILAETINEIGFPSDILVITKKMSDEELDHFISGLSDERLDEFAALCEQVMMEGVEPEGSA
jgi:hypothetical protein